MILFRTRNIYVHYVPTDQLKGQDANATPPCAGSNWLNDSDSSFTSCCQIFHSIFNLDNIDNIMEIMKYSIGLPAPKSLPGMANMTEKEYHHMLFPNGGYLSQIENMG